MTEPFSMDQAFIRKLTDIILANLDNEEFGVSELIIESGLSRHFVTTKLHEITNKNINQFIREVRLQKALEMLKTGKVTASEVAYKVGFGSPAYFNTCFHEHFGFTPGHVKREELYDGADFFLLRFLKSIIKKLPGRRSFSSYQAFCSWDFWLTLLIPHL